MKLNHRQTASLRYDVAQVATVLEDVLHVLTPKKKKLKVFVVPTRLRGEKRTGPNKTQLMLNVLKDGKPHPVTLLALAGGTTSGHVATHLKKRIDRGEIRRTKPGVFQIVVGRKRAAA